MKNIEVLKKICEDCIIEGESLMETQFVGYELTGDKYVDLEKFHKWKSNCNVLINLLGELSNPWKSIFDGDKGNSLVNAMTILGGIKSINETIDKGYLLRIEDIIFAEAFSNLIEQAEYLYSQQYILAAGVLGRAVLEEKLRNLCSSQEIEFKKSRPTLSDYNMELYKSKFYDKIEHKNIDYLISIGNSAAHNQPITKEDVKDLIDGVNRILIKYN